MDAQKIVRELIESIEDKNFYYGERMERNERQHRVEISEKNEEIAKLKSDLSDFREYTESQETTIHKRQLENLLEAAKEDLKFFKTRYEVAIEFAKEIMDDQQFKDFDERLNK